MENNSAEPRLSSYLHAKACRAGTPLAGNFELTPRCNFNCKMCYVHLSEAEQKRRGAELSADEWLSIAETARSQGMLFLLLTGGEPLIRPDFRYILSELKKMGLMVSINSNASLIDKDMLDFFRHEPPFRFNITLYGASGAAYERLCGSNAFDRVVDNIQALKDIGIGVKLNVSLTQYNAADMQRIYEIAESLGTPMQLATYMFPPIRRDTAMVGENDRFSAEEAAKYSVMWDRMRFSEAGGGHAPRHKRKREYGLRRHARRGHNVPRGQERILDKLAGRNDPMRHDDRTRGKREGAWVHKGLGSYKGGNGTNTPVGGVRRMRI